MLSPISSFLSVCAEHLNVGGGGGGCIIILLALSSHPINHQNTHSRHPPFPGLYLKVLLCKERAYKESQALTELSYSHLKCHGRRTNLGHLRYIGPRPRFKNCASRAISLFHLFSQIATLCACYYDASNISEFNCQTGVRSNVLFEQEGGWMEVVSIYWTVSQLLWVNFSKLQVARGWYIWSFTAGTCVCVCICETIHCKKMWGCLHNSWSASRVTVKGWDQSSKLLLSSPSTSSHHTASSKHRVVCLKLCTSTWLEN